jgi:ribosomal protein S18 acetylase RimI-like enzyme
MSLMADLRSLGYRTDLIFPRYDGELTDRGDYIIVRTPSNPTFYWGNFLLFRNPPAAGDDQRWRSLFEQEFGRPPVTTHEAYGWDSPEGERGLVTPFLDSGFDLVVSRVLFARRVIPPDRSVPGVTFRILETEEDWQRAVDLQTLTRPEGHAEAGHRAFRQRQMERYRAMQADGRGQWFGAFAGDQLVADLGLFREDDLARFQSVETHPDFRRRGIAGWLVYEASRAMLADQPQVTLVMVADDGSSAERLYRSVGFEPREYQMGLELWPRAL